MSPPDFDWREDAECIVCPHQPRTAVYFNPQHVVVLRQENEVGEDDSVVLVAPENAEAIAKAIVETAADARRQAMADRPREEASQPRLVRQAPQIDTFAERALA